MLQDIVKNYELIKGRTENTSEYVLTLANDKKVKVAKSYIDKNMKNLELDLEETLLMYLEDNDYIINEEQEELDKRAKGIVKTIATKETPKKKTQKERTQKDNPTKELIIQTVVNALQTLGVDNLNVENKAKLVTFTLDNKDFKVDLVEKRKPKVK
jgi:hypothetical protein